MEPLLIAGAAVLGYLVATKDKNGKPTIVLVPSEPSTVIKPRRGQTWTELGNLDASVVTDYTKVFEAIIPAGSEGLLNEISLYSSIPDTTQWMLIIAEKVQFENKRIYQSLTLPYNSLAIYAMQKITLMAKTAGVATDIAGSLTGQLYYVGD